MTNIFLLFGTLETLFKSYNLPPSSGSGITNSCSLNMSIWLIRTSFRCWLKLKLDAVTIKSLKNSCDPGKDGGGQGPPSFEGVTRRSWSRLYFSGCCFLRSVKKPKPVKKNKIVPHE